MYLAELDEDPNATGCAFPSLSAICLYKLDLIFVKSTEELVQFWRMSHIGVRRRGEGKEILSALTYVNKLIIIHCSQPTLFLTQ